MMCATMSTSWLCRPGVESPARVRGPRELVGIIRNLTPRPGRLRSTRSSPATAAWARGRSSPLEASMAARSFGATPSTCRLSVWPAPSSAISAVPRCEDRPSGRMRFLWSHVSVSVPLSPGPPDRPVAGDSAAGAVTRRETALTKMRMFASNAASIGSRWRHGPQS